MECIKFHRQFIFYYLCILLTCITYNVFFPVICSAGQIYYKGNLDIKKTYGDICSGKEVGNNLPVELVYDVKDEQISGYIVIPGRPVGKISGQKLDDLSLEYPVFYQYFKDGHKISLSEGKVVKGLTRFLNSLVKIKTADGKSIKMLPESDKISGQIKEKQNGNNNMYCSIVLGELELTPSEPELAKQYYERMENLYSADLLYSEGRSDYYKGDYIEAKRKNEKALEIRERYLGPDDENVSDSLGILAGFYIGEGKYDEAILLYNRCLAIEVKLYGQNSIQVATTFLFIAIAKVSMGQYEEAESFYNRGKDICEKTTGTQNAFYPMFLLGLADLYFDLGRYSEMEPLCNQAISILNKVSGIRNYQKAQALAIQAKMYYFTGQYEKSESNIKKALNIVEAETSQSNEEVSKLLNMVASIYISEKKYYEAEKLFLRAITINEKNFGKEALGNATTLSNLSVLYGELGRYSDAEIAGLGALRIRRKYQGNENKFVAYCLHNLAETYTKVGRFAEAEALFIEGLEIAEISRDPYLLFNLQDGYSRLLALNSRLSPAIYFGKKAVNNIQGLRQNVSKLGEETLKRYDRTVEKSYRHLSDLLIDEGRLHEAQQVIDLLKQQEFFRFVRRNESLAVTLSSVSFTKLENQLDIIYRKAAEELVLKYNEIQKLENVAEERKIKEEEKQNVVGKYEKIKKNYSAYVVNIVSTLQSSKKDKYDKSNNVLEDDRIKKWILKQGEGAVLIYTLTGEKRFRIILVTSGFSKSYTSDIGERVLNKEIAKFRETISDPQKLSMRDAQLLAKKLYQYILKPAEDDLGKLKIKTLIWSLDGSLRYLPVAALHDGEVFLVEKYRNVVINPALGFNADERPRTSWEGLGLGVSKRHGNFPELQSVPGELSAVINIGNQSAGVVRGSILLDESFTKNSLIESLKRGYTLVHVASHFKFTPGNDTMSFLLLGDGDHLSLNEINTKGILFDKVDLLTLSACETAAGDAPNATGSEVEGFSVIAQKKGANSVLATLWPVADESTGLLMREFYKHMLSGPGITKAEALQRAQVGILRGEITGGRDFSHPYFWGPFVLSGKPL